MNEIKINRKRPIIGMIGAPLAFSSFLIGIWISIQFGSEIKEFRWFTLLFLPGLLFFGFQLRRIIKGPEPLIIGFNNEHFYAKGCLAGPKSIRDNYIEINKISHFSIEPRVNVNGIYIERCLIAYLNNGSDENIVNFYRPTAKVDSNSEFDIIRFIKKMVSGLMYIDFILFLILFKK